MKKKAFNPFPGLRPFQKHESHLFFGRQNHIKEILRKLETFRFVSIVGNSGSGKSSLVRAGIIPQIENNENHSWIVCVMHPGKNPVEELCNALFSQDLFGSNNLEERKQQVNSSIEILNKNRLGLVQTVRNILPENKRLLILVDQFEELFRFSSIYHDQNKFDTASHFVDLLLGAISQKDLPIYVMLTVRSDFLGDCEQFMGLPEAINDGQFLIPRMNREELQSSITKPVEAVQGKISPRLVHQLLNEVGNSPDQLPLLQHVLMRTWKAWENENNPSQPIDIEEYEKTGGMEKALSNHAEEAYAELNSERKKHLCAALFKTITMKGADNRGIRRPTSVKKLMQIMSCNLNEIIEISDIFRRSDRGFLMPPEQIELNENSILDISHESLMRVWDRMKVWVDEEANAAEIYHRITENALLYEKNMAGLWRDPDLQIALDWRNEIRPNLAWAEQYNSNFKLAIDFIEVSLQDKLFMISEKSRTKKITNALVITVLFVLSALTIWAFNERNKSEKNENMALIEKQKALQQEALTKQQKTVAEENFLKAEKEKSNAEMQKKIAEQNSLEADLQKKKAERASLNANDARRSAELDKQIALLQRQISDSLQTVAVHSEKNAYRLRILSIAQNLAIKSSHAQKGTYDDAVKPLLSLQAYYFNLAYKGKSFDPEIFTALFSSYRFLHDKISYAQNYHSDAVRAVCFSPDGKNIASAGNDGKLIVCNARDIQSNSQYFPQQLLIENIAYNKAGNKIAAIADNKSVLLYDTDKPTVQPKQIIGLHSDRISGLGWYKNLIITASFDMNIRLIDYTSSKVVKTFSLESKPLSISICEDKNLLTAGCENGCVYLIDLSNKKETRKLNKASSGRITSVDFNTEGTKIACGTSDGYLIVIYTESPDLKEINIAAHNSGITNVKFNPVENSIASSSLDGTVKLWNLNTPDDQPIIFAEHDSWVWGICFSPDGSQLVSCGKDKSVITYLIKPDKLIHSILSKLNRNFSLSEWSYFVGADIPYEKTISLK